MDMGGGGGGLGGGGVTVEKRGNLLVRWCWNWATRCHVLCMCVCVFFVCCVPWLAMSLNRILHIDFAGANHASETTTRLINANSTTLSPVEPPGEAEGVVAYIYSIKSAHAVRP